MKRFVALILTFLLTTSCSSSGGDSQVFLFLFDFEDNSESWVAGFADLPADFDEDLYMLESDHRTLPEPLAGSGLFIQGTNRSDDLFMFFKRQIEGLSPNTNYSIIFNVEFATEAETGSVGIGGSPGDSVYVKVGATAIEPDVVVDELNQLRMNIDKANQSQSGEDMIVIGNVGSDRIENPGDWVLKELGNDVGTFSATSDAEGRIWLIVGTDSGFEGQTRLYYSNIEVELRS